MPGDGCQASTRFGLVNRLEVLNKRFWRPGLICLVVFSGATKHGNPVRGVFNGLLNNANRPRLGGCEAAATDSQSGRMRAVRRVRIGGLGGDGAEGEAEGEG